MTTNLETVEAAACTTASCQCTARLTCKDLGCEVSRHKVLPLPEVARQDVLQETAAAGGLADTLTPQGGSSRPQAAARRRGRATTSEHRAEGKRASGCRRLHQPQQGLP